MDGDDTLMDTYSATSNPYVYYRETYTATAGGSSSVFIWYDFEDCVRRSFARTIPIPRNWRWYLCFDIKPGGSQAALSAPPFFAPRSPLLLFDSRTTKNKNKRRRFQQQLRRPYFL